MHQQSARVAVDVMAAVAMACPADDGPQATWLDALIERETLTDDGFGLGEQLARRGLTVSLGLTEVYQINTHGGLNTDRRKGRWAGSYDLEIEVDFETLISLPGASAYMLAEGSWSAGLDPISVGSVFGVNDDAGGNRKCDVTELWYEQALFDGTVRVRLGKLDLTGGFECRGCPAAFDGNACANDETAQFLNSALVNNPTIPLPDNGPALCVHVQPVERAYVAAGIADAQADARETGLRTAFHDEDYFFSIFEVGVAPRMDGPNGPLQGMVRAGLWYDPQDKARNSGSTKRDDVGFYLSADQVVLKENADEEDAQGLAVFGRLGYADHDVSAVRCFWSLGAQYQGLLPSREDDVIAFGAAQGRLTKAAGFTETSETVMEAYYNAAVTGWLNVSPSVQCVVNPGGTNTVKDAVVVGVRVQMAF